MTSATGRTIERQRILIQGIVQGVGFRPFIYGLALRWGLVGFVRNDSAGVTIEVEGTPAALDGFQRALHTETPPLARIDTVVVEPLPPRQETTFVIAHSQAGAERLALISPDMATCDDCLRELFDPADRRYRYPFTNCTNCGPRFTIVQDVPYDRDKTTMRVFPMCPACQKEYDDPLNRRFHAQPNACPVCGPQVYLLNDKTYFTAEGAVRDPARAIAMAAQQLASGAILAIKGLGGYHLACDALNAEAVQRLRQRKHREAKPFALMVPDVATARQLCEVSDAEAALLQAHRRPIVLLRQHPDCPVAPGVAPAYDTLGIMLPYTPLHHLLLAAFADLTTQPTDSTPALPACGEGVSGLSPQAGGLRGVHQQGAGEPTARPAVLVMTSGNLSEEPIAYRDDDARERLAPIADDTLAHNRDIHMRCDDSVVRIVAGGTQFFRRSRGYAPEPIPLAMDLPAPMLACGGHLKNTFCLGKGRQAFVSHHIGDLENLETLTSFREGIVHFERLFDIHPEVVAYDLHPEYLATKYALDRDVSVKIGVQHHHAHIASVLAEHGLEGPVIGVAADGTGYGTDGAVWGCELMVADLAAFARLAHLAYVPLPGGDQAVRQPWRMAAVYLTRAYGDAFPDTMDIPFVWHLDRARWHVLAQMIARGLNSPPTSSLGRLFDAVAALVGLRGEVYYEGQAAIELEMVADESRDPYPFGIAAIPALMSFTSSIEIPTQGPLGPERYSGPSGPRWARYNGQPAALDVAPVIRAITEDLQRGVPVSRIAGRFHATIAALLAAACERAREASGLNVVALSGGVFQNRLLLEQLTARLEASGFQVYTNRRVPPNDGGLSLGQLAVAAAQLRSQPQLAAAGGG
jgi:hydrogenase maturation protein HypF